MKKLIFLTLYSALLSFLFSSNALADGTVDYFTISEIATGKSVNDTFVIYGDFTVSDCTTHDALLVDPAWSANKNYMGMVKMMYAAFLAGKQIKVKYSDTCNGNYSSVIQMWICVDGTSCGQ